MIKLNFGKITLLVVVFIILAVILYDSFIKPEKSCDCNSYEGILKTESQKTTEIEIFKKDVSLISAYWHGFTGEMTDIRNTNGTDDDFCFYICGGLCSWMDYYYKNSVVLVDFYDYTQEIEKDTDLCSCECYINREDIPSNSEP